MIEENKPAITKEDLTDKEIFCIARHMQRYVEVLIHENPEFPDPCNYCPRGSECAKRNFMFAWDVIGKLRDITGAEMGPGRRRKVK